jgi:L-rhamnose mutarotase
MKRYGMVLRIREGKVDRYQELHAAVWPEVLRHIFEANIRNYSIFLRQLDDGRHYLFSYFEYVGSDFAADMVQMAASPITQKWWSECEPCQDPLASRAPGEWWAGMAEVFHCD